MDAQTRLFVSGLVREKVNRVSKPRQNYDIFGRKHLKISITEARQMTSGVNSSVENIGYISRQ